MRKSILLVTVFWGLLNIGSIGWAIPNGGVQFLKGTTSYFDDLSVSGNPFKDLDGRPIVERSDPSAGGIVVGGSHSIGIDLPFGFGPFDDFSNVRLKDYLDQWARSSTPPYKADTDGVGAIITGPPIFRVSEPGTMLLLGLGVIVLAKYARRKLMA